MTADKLKLETIARLKQAFEHAADPDLRGAYDALSGSALTNGWNTLRRQWLYVMGHNPGGDPVTHPASDYSIRLATEGLSNDATGLDDNGSAQFNRVVRSLIEGFSGSETADQTFVTNALFVRSQGSADLASKEDAIFDACWPVHKWFLSIVQPRLILCLGYQQDPKKRLPFRRIAEKMRVRTLTPIERAGQRFGVWVDGQLPVGAGQSLPVALAAVYHPSARNGASWSTDRLNLFATEIAPELQAKLG